MSEIDGLPERIADASFKPLCIIGTLAGIAYGFAQGGIGSSIARALFGCIAGLIANFVLVVMLGLAVAVLPFFIAIALGSAFFLAIRLLWDVGKL